MELRKPVHVLSQSSELAPILLQGTADVKNFFSQSYETAVGRPLGGVKDYRLIDIARPERSNRTPQVRLRRLLAERSLAIEFDRWNPDRLPAILEAKSFKLSKHTDGSIRAFVKEILHLRDNFTARNAVKNGLRHRAMEKTFPSLASLSLVFAFADHRLQNMSYEELTATISSTLSELSRLVERNSAWMEDAQAYYDGQAPRRSFARKFTAFLLTSTNRSVTAVSFLRPVSEEVQTLQVPRVRYSRGCRECRKRRIKACYCLRPKFVSSILTTVLCSATRRLGFASNAADEESTARGLSRAPFVGRTG